MKKLQANLADGADYLFKKSKINLREKKSLKHYPKQSLNKRHFWTF